MVRINLINPRYLADQHLIAEYNEILMLFGYVKKHPNPPFHEMPKNYKLGKGHILFFKNKLKYLAERFEKIKKEMRKRGFKPQKKIFLKKVDRRLINSWRPNKKDKEVIKKRLIEKIKNKPGYYKYNKEKKTEDFFMRLLENAS